MTLTERSKFWLVVTLIIIAGFLGGVLGNWIFIYVLDTYYGIPAGNYAAAPADTNIVVRQPSRPAPSAASDTAVTVEKSLAGVFKRAGNGAYAPAAKLGQGAIITSDGWIVSTYVPTPDAAGNWQEYVVSASGRLYDIDRIVVDAPSQLAFIHLKKANSLPVREFALRGELAAFQAVSGIEWQGNFETGYLGRMAEGVRSSDTSLPELAVSGLSGRSLILFDQSGRVIGLSRGRSVIAMDTVKALTDKLLTDGKIERARLGIRYLSLSVTTGSKQDGALLVDADKAPAVVAASPAEKAGLKAGDIITSVADVSVGNGTDIAALIAEYKPGDKIAIAYVRSGEKKETTVTLDALVQK